MLCYVMYRTASLKQENKLLCNLTEVTCQIILTWICREQQIKNYNKTILYSFSKVTCQIILTKLCKDKIVNKKFLCSLVKLCLLLWIRRKVSCKVILTRKQLISFHMFT